MMRRRSKLLSAKIRDKSLTADFMELLLSNQTINRKAVRLWESPLDFEADAIRLVKAPREDEDEASVAYPPEIRVASPKRPANLNHVLRKREANEANRLLKLQRTRLNNNLDEKPIKALLIAPSKSPARADRAHSSRSPQHTKPPPEDTEHVAAHNREHRKDTCKSTRKRPHDKVYDKVNDKSSKYPPLPLHSIYLHNTSTSHENLLARKTKP